MRNKLLLLTVASIIMVACPERQEGPATTNPIPADLVTFCGDGTDELCSMIPHDITHQLTIDYTGLSSEQQFFDYFAWQMFVALNWPANEDGTPSSTKIGGDPQAKRVWQFYQTADDVFGLAPSLSDTCQEESQTSPRPVVHLTSQSGQALATGNVPAGLAQFLESTGQPLIDRNLNFVLYDVLLNPIEVAYLTAPENDLTTKSGQAAFRAAGKTVSFPLGHYSDGTKGGSVGAIELKSAWRILDEANGDVTSDYFTMDTQVVISADNSDSGEGFCFPATLGLVGFHIVQRTQGPGGEPQNWIWASFEHKDNAPLAANAQDPTQKAPTITNCEAPTGDTTRYSFFNAACGDCPTNQPPILQEGQTHFTWSTTPPYAAKYATNGFGTQVVRCWQIYSETQATNQAWQAKLSGTVWANYQLIGTQWQSKAPDPEVPEQAVPHFLSNTSLETYIQISERPVGSCLGCHQQAITTAKQDANFSWLLILAQ